MAGSRRTITRGWFALLAGVGLGTASCGELPSTNPFDPATPVTLEVVGPDSAALAFDTLTYRLVTEPAYEHADPTWRVIAEILPVDTIFQPVTTIVPSSTAGAFRLALDARFYATTRFTVIATLGPRHATKVTVFPHVRTVTAMWSRDCLTNSHDVTVTGIGSSVVLCATLVDQFRVPLGSVLGVDDGTQIVIRNPTVLTRSTNPNQPAGKFIAQAPGSTYVTFARSGFADSVLVTVTR